MLQHRQPCLLSKGSRCTLKMESYEPLPWQLPVLRDTSRVILLAGAAGGGKSHVAAEKMHGYLQRYPGATGLIVRKTLTSMTNSTLLFLSEVVIGDTPGVVHRPSDRRFEYKNGSVLAYGGMFTRKQREAMRGIGARGGVDIIWMEEATEFDESDYDELLFRLRGKAAPWRQVMLSTNPDGPLHWINVRLILGGQARVFESRAADNLHNPDDYLNTLDRTSGVERKRLFDGQWAESGTMVYERWRDNIGATDDGGGWSHVSEEADYVPGGGSIYWGVDDGYAGDIDKRTGLFKAKSHPRVFLLSQLRHGVLNIFAESYRVKTTHNKHIASVLGLGYPLPEYAVVDKSAAALKGYLHDGSFGDTDWQIYTRNSPPRVEESIKVMRQWLDPGGGDPARIRVHPRCTHLRAEMAMYGLDPLKGEPIKDFDHGPDAIRSLTWDLRVR